MRILRSMVLILAVSATGCGDDPARRVTPQPEPYPSATTPDQLVVNLVDSWMERNFPEFDRLLHDDFAFKFAIDDIDDSQSELGVWDRSRTAATVEALFAGREGKIDPLTGEPAPPVGSFSLVLSPVGEWRTDASPEFAADAWREYDVDMDVWFLDGNVAEVQGRQRFYVARVDGPASVFQLRRWEDSGNPNAGKTGRASTRASSWGKVLSWF